MAGNNVWSLRYSSLSACLVCVKPWVQSLAPFKPFVVAHACKPSTREVEAEGSVSVPTDCQEPLFPEGGGAGMETAWVSPRQYN